MQNHIQMQSPEKGGKCTGTLSCHHTGDRALRNSQKEIYIPFAFSQREGRRGNSKVKMKIVIHRGGRFFLEDPVT